MRTWTGDGSAGQPQALQLTPDGTSSSGTARLAMVCTADSDWRHLCLPVER